MFPALLLVAAIVAADTPAKPTPLEGYWESTAPAAAPPPATPGKRAAGVRVARPAYRFTGNHYEMFLNGTSVAQGDFTIDETASPRRIVRKAFKAGDRTIGADTLGIFELSGDTLRLAFASGRGVDATAYPTGFDAKYQVADLKRGTPPAPKKSADEDVEAMLKTDRPATAVDGTWTLVKATDHGADKSAAVKAGASITFRGDKYVVRAGGRVVDHGTIRVDAAKGYIERQTAKAANAKLDPGIYELKGDSLKTAFDRPGKTERPVGFDGQMYEVNEFTRAK